MTRQERQCALAVIGECEVRGHGWSEAEVAQLRTEIADWWKIDAPACEAYLAAESANARTTLNQLTGKRVAA